LREIRLDLHILVSQVNLSSYIFADFVSERSAKTAVREMQSRRKICGRKRVKVELSNRARKKRDRERSISPETYRKYGSRTPSPELREESRSRSRSPIRSKPLFWVENDIDRKFSQAWLK